MTICPLIVCLFSFAGVMDSKSCIKSDEIVEFFPTIGHRSMDGRTWELPIHGWIYEPDSEIAELTRIAMELGIGKNAPEGSKGKIYTERVRRFMTDNERGKEIVIRLAGRLFEMNESESSGHFTGRIRLTVADVKALRRNSANSDGIDFQPIMRQDDHRVFAGHVFLVEPTGVSIISDIDDTVRITNVRDRKEAIANTFLRPFRAVPEMAGVYSHWAKTPGIAFHYVSASAWQLYAPFVEFMRQAGFPAGSFHLKLLRFKGRNLVDLFTSFESHKLTEIESIFRQFPKRRFVLVGDSGQRDPETYAALARRFPDQVVRVLIRDVTGEGRDAARYQNVYKDLPDSLWTVFREAREIRDALPRK